MTEFRDRLVELLKEHSMRWAPPGQPFTLASGAKSDYFIDVKMTALLGEGHRILGELLCSAMFEQFGGNVRTVAGVELGGCPLASAVATTAHRAYGVYVNALYVRKKAKDHGTAKLVEGGIVIGDTQVVLLEDVFTTGGSSIRAVQTLQEAGCKVLGVIGVVDREQGAQAAFQEAGIKAHALLRVSELR